MAPKNSSGRKNDKETSNKIREYPFLSLNRNIAHLFDTFYHGIGLAPFSALGSTAGFIPRVDVYESRGEIKVIAEIPGLDENDIDVSITDDVLIIAGEKKNKEEESEICYKAECLYGWFTRSIPIPVEIDTDNVNARVKNGILTVILYKIPKSASNRKKVHIIGD
jgi:HSP20 family protein